MRRAALALALLAAPAAARAGLVAPGRAGVALPELSSGRPTLLVPVFARCAGTCPITTESLRESLAAASARFRVAVLTFDPQDTARDLEAFRARRGLPAQWDLVRPDAPRARELLERLDFRFMTAPGGFDHPDEVFVLSPRGAWAGTFLGPEFSASELSQAYRRALEADETSTRARLKALGRRPELWLSVAAAGLACSLLAVFFLGARVGRAPGGR